MLTHPHTYHYRNSGYFEISEVVGIPEINSAVYPISHGRSYLIAQRRTTPTYTYDHNASIDYKEPVKTVRIPFKFSSELGHQYVSGGIMTEKKIPVKYPMKSLKELLKNPGIDTNMHKRL